MIGTDWRDSEPWWPEEPDPPPGAPNVVLIVLDDVGYAQLGCYGSDIDTPVIDALAAGGVRLANFHTTALCSPTRSCLLTGRNHHRNAMGRVADLAMGYPGYWGQIPIENGFLSEILGQEGYASYAVGKWHLTPDEDTHMGASRRTWPLGRGFDRWYGFHGGETHQFAPALYHDNHAVAPPGTFEDRLPPERGPGRSGHRVPGRPAGRRRSAPVLPVLRQRGLPFPPPAAGGVGAALPGPVRRRLGRVARAHLLPPAGHGPGARGHRAVAAPALGAGLGRPGSRRPGGGGTVHGVLRRLPVPHRRPDRPGARLHRPARRARQHPGDGGVGQRGQRRGRGPGVDQRRPADQPGPGRSSRAASAHRRDRHPQHPQQLPVGLDDGRQHARSGAGSARCTRAAWPIPAS